MDKMNQAILQRLRDNGRLSWQQIGKEVHLTGQAVAARVQQMLDQRYITGFTIRQDEQALHYVTVFMKSTDFDGFERFLQREADVRSAHKVSGEGCYHLVLVPADAQALDAFLTRLLAYGTYKVLSGVRCVK
jgi:Lrp/AsnC family leucine-responsive transcriptional regulator